MPKPLVSIAIAACRTKPQHLAAAIASACAQTWREIEVLVSDDSPEPTLQPLVESVGDPRVRYVRHSSGLGVAANHAWCLGASRSEFIVILNHDDLLDAGFVEALMQPLLADETLALAFCDHWVIDADGQRLQGLSDATSRTWGRSTLRAGAHRPFLPLLAAQTVPMAMGTVFRKTALLQRLPADAGPAYDLWLTYLLARSGLGASYVPRRLSAWRTHAGNLTSQGGADWILGAANCWETIAADPACRSIRGSARAKAAQAFLSCALRALQAGFRNEAAALAARSLRATFTLKGLVACSITLLPLPVSRRLLALARRA